MAVSKVRSRAIKKAWRRRKREKAYKAICYRCGKPIWTRGIKRKGHWFHRNCYEEYIFRVPDGRVRRG